MPTMENTALKMEASHFLYPGMLIAVNEPGTITTILGSCVSVCLWDPVQRVGGMNHYLLPYWNGEGLQTPKYGNVAITTLIERMIAIGSRRENLQAKVFGGASMLDNSCAFLNIGERNVMLAETALSESRITVASRNVGGNQGRKIMFMTDSGDVFMKKIVKKQEG